MRLSLTGLFRNTAEALRQSPDGLSCAMAYSLGQLIDHLKLVKSGDATFAEFFEAYVFDARSEDLAESVKPADYLCMQAKPDDDEADNG